MQHFWSFIAKQCFSILLNHWSRWGHEKKNNWKTFKCLQKPQNSKFIRKVVNYTLDTPRFCLKDKVWLKSFQINFGSLGFLKTQFTPDMGQLSHWSPSFYCIDMQTSESEAIHSPWLSTPPHCVNAVLILVHFVWYISVITAFPHISHCHIPLVTLLNWSVLALILVLTDL